MGRIRMPPPPVSTVIVREDCPASSDDCKTYVDALRYVQREAAGLIVQLRLLNASGLYDIVDEGSADAELTVFDQDTSASELQIVNEDPLMAPGNPNLYPVP